MNENLDITRSPSRLKESTARFKKNMMITLICSALICGSLTIFTPIVNDRAFYSDVLAIVTSGAAFVLSAQIIIRQKTKGVAPRLYVALGLAVTLWFAAETLWAYYELVAGIETPFPSIADALWLGGYVPFFYFLLGILKRFVGATRSLYVPLLLSTSIGLLLVANVIYSLYLAADLTSQEGVVTYLVSAAYPLVDLFLIVPAITAFIQLRKGRLTFTPWFCFVIASIIFIGADIGFAYFIQLGWENAIWIWNPFYNIAYLAIASALFWHKSFFTVDEKKMANDWKEKNR